MGDTNGRKIKRFLVGLTWKRKKSGKKYKNAIEWYVLILKKQENQGETKWVKDAKQKALSRIKKYSITKDQVTKALEHKGLNNLISKIDL